MCVRVRVCVFVCACVCVCVCVFELVLKTAHNYFYNVCGWSVCMSVLPISYSIFRAAMTHPLLLVKWPHIWLLLERRQIRGSCKTGAGV